jgi:hypothetical protein
MKTVANGQPNTDDIAAATSGMNETSNAANAILRYVRIDQAFHMG